ncbi:MAG: Transcriptional regulator, TetR family [Labilithrix sp.]|nr:Transcriptional regulator, TetR family [Labilithrix sp.]
MARSPRIEALYDVFLRKRPRQSRSRSVVEAILGATGERLSAAEAEDAVTVQGVAERAGVGIGSLYDYFRDREGLLAGFAAKVTEDNLRDFEELLARTRSLPLRESVALIVDHAFAIYAESPKVARSIMRIAHAVGFVPTAIEGQNAFAAALGRALVERTDLPPRDFEAAGYVLTHSIMGVMLTQVWQNEAPVPREHVRNELVTMCCEYLGARGDAPAGPDPMPAADA